VQLAGMAEATVMRFLKGRANSKGRRKPDHCDCGTWEGWRQGIDRHASKDLSSKGRIRNDKLWVEVGGRYEEGVLTPQSL